MRPNFERGFFRGGFFARGKVATHALAVEVAEDAKRHDTVAIFEPSDRELLCFHTKVAHSTGQLSFSKN